MTTTDAIPPVKTKKLKSPRLTTKLVNETLRLYKEDMEKPRPYGIPSGVRNVSTNPTGYPCVSMYSVGTGCGFGMARGITILNTNRRAIVKQMYDYAKAQNWGAVGITLGNTYYNGHHKALIDLGFEQVAEYQNLAHNAPYTQRLYILRIDRKKSYDDAHPIPVEKE